MGVFVASFLTALCVSALCSFTESILLSLSTAQIAEIKKKNKQIGEIWEYFKKNVDAPITAILALNTAAHTIGASVAGAAFANLWGDSNLWIFSVVFTFLMLQYTEILPKTLGVRYNKRFAFWVARPLWWATTGGAPIIRFIRLCNRPFEPRGSEGDALSSIQELRFLTTAAKDSKQIDEEQAEVINETLDLNQTPVREIMTPIVEAKTLDAGLTLEEAMKKAIEDGHTRFPIADAQGRVEKYVNFKEIARGVARKQLNGEVLAPDGGSELDKIARELLVVSPDAVASEMLTLFVDESQHIAVVRDATGENVGILTLEDIVEEMLGEIKDEFDCHNRIDERTDALLCGGGCELADVVKEIEEKFPGRCAEAVAALKKFDPETTDEAADDWETRRLNAWFRSRLPKTQKKVLRVSSVPLGDLRVDAHNVQYGQLKEAIIRLRDDVEK